MRTNYHTHTQRCGHAIGSDEAYVQNAIIGGYELLGFSDHTPWPFKDGYTSYMRMHMWELDGYVHSIRELQAKYSSQIEILVGLECEFYTEYIEWLREQKERLKLDYLLFGNHYAYYERGAPYSGFASTQKDLDLYLRSSIEGMQTGLFECFAHPELYMRGWGKADKAAIETFRELCCAARDLGVVMEFNTSMEYYEPLWQEAAAEGVQVIIGGDIHNRKLLKSSATFDNALTTLRRLGIEPLERLPIRG